MFVVFPVENRLHAQEDIRGPLSELQQQVLPDIQDQLQDYRCVFSFSLNSYIAAALTNTTKCDLCWQNESQ